jgi:hypothetical protein
LHLGFLWEEFSANFDRANNHTGCAMPTKKPPNSFLKRVNCTRVSAELLGEVMEMHAGLSPEDRTVFEVRAIRMFELLDSKGLGKDRADLAMAIDFRLSALARMQKDKVLRGWTMPGAEAGMDYIHADLLKAAAEEPLIEDSKGQAVFDVQKFRNRVLANAQMRGNA